MSKGNPSKKQHRSMRGKQVDMDLLQQRNELTPAVGNARVNARGDELGPGGKIIRKKEDILNDYYENSDRLPDVPMPTKAADAAVKTDPETAATTLKTKKPTTSKANADTPVEKDLTDDWVEDDDGNFVQKED